MGEKYQKRGVGENLSEKKRIETKVEVKTVGKVGNTKN
jgi:hypothetical protein